MIPYQSRKLEVLQWKHFPVDLFRSSSALGAKRTAGKARVLLQRPALVEDEVRKD